VHVRTRTLIGSIKIEDFGRNLKTDEPMIVSLRYAIFAINDRRSTTLIYNPDCNRIVSGWQGTDGGGSR